MLASTRRTRGAELASLNKVFDAAEHLKLHVRMIA